MSDDNKNEEQTKQEVKLEDLCVEESTQDEVKGGPNFAFQT